MKLRTYSSISAFLAYYEALRAAAGYARGGAQRPLTVDERRSLAEMDALLRGTLTEGERAALSVGGLPPHEPVAGPEAPLDASGPATTGPATNGATARRRARAELKLRHALAARGLLTA